MTVANSVSISQSIAGRYAQAVFEIAKESGGMDALATQTDDLNAALHDSAELRDLSRDARASGREGDGGAMLTVSHGAARVVQSCPRAGG